MSGDWERLADHVRSARNALGLTQRQLADAADVAYATVQSIERAEPRTRIPDSIPAIERVLGWAPGTSRKLVVRPEAQVPPFDAPLEELQAAVQNLLDGDAELSPRQAAMIQRALESKTRHDV